MEKLSTHLFVPSPSANYASGDFYSSIYLPNENGVVGYSYETSDVYEGIPGAPHLEGSGLVNAPYAPPGVDVPTVLLDLGRRHCPGSS